ncbi:TetR/AcrR family transcriptional regulator [Neorhizobium sp. T7_12]|uniref:TetR/AcrR family transcriptional regulator n=1 Tax=Neorhizobium sp. T7_12 TaxID=2093832 RepID=UPI000CFA6C3B|nr:TetR/AcrR family transcriptional regulator [Neorhizobium sp. T7_12]
MNSNRNRDTFIRTALALFRRRGYEGVGVNEILLETGLPKGSLYYHFPGGKEQLAEEAARLANRIVSDRIEACFISASSFAEGAAALCRDVGRLATDGGKLAGCPLMSISQAAGDENSKLQSTTRDALAGWTDRITHHAMRFGICDPEDAATLLLLQVEGAWLIAKVQQSTAAFDVLARNLAGSLAD